MMAAIEFMSGDPNFSQADGWAYYMDAGILQAVNDGWNEFQGNDAIGDGGHKWAHFFSQREACKPACDSDDSLIATRLGAEQAGVDYAAGLAESSNRHDSASVIDQVHIEAFLTSANGYRALAPHLRQVLGAVCGACDPRTSARSLGIMGRAVRPLAWFLYGQIQTPGIPPPAW
jgi:hypothetical protein